MYGQIVNELVEWFNLMDATYRSDLWEFNELNFARFDAKLETRLDAKFERRFDRLERRLDQQNRLFILAWITLVAAVVGMSLRPGAP